MPNGATKADGTILINTKINTSGVSTGMEEIEKLFAQIASASGNASQAMGAAMNGASAQTRQMATEVKTAATEMELALSGGFSRSVSSSMLRLRDLEIEVADKADALDAAFKKGLDPTTSKDVAKMEREYTKAYNKLATEREKLGITVAKEAQKQSDAEIKAAKKAAQEQQRQQRNNQKNAAGVIEQVGGGLGLSNLGGLVGGIVASVGTVNPVPAIIGAVFSGIGMIKDALSGLFSGIKKIFNFVTAPIKKQGNLIKRISIRILSIAGSAFIFRGLGESFRDLSDYLSTALIKTGDMKQALSNLKGALLQAAIPIIESLTPAMVSLANTTAAVVSNIAQLFALFSGKTISNISATAKQFYNTANAAGKASKAVAGFDQLTKLSDNSGGSQTEILPNFDYVDTSGGIYEFFQNLKESIDAQNWYEVGQQLVGSINSAIENTDWSQFGQSAGEIAGGLLVAILGAISNLDYKAIGEALRTFAASFMVSLSTEIQNADWFKIGGDLAQGLSDAFTAALPILAGMLKGVQASLVTTPIFAPLASIAGTLSDLFGAAALISGDNAEITKAASELIGSVCGALLAAALGAGNQLKETGLTIWNTLKEKFIDSIDWGEAPWNIIDELWDGLIEELKDVGEWVRTNVWEPFRDAFCEAAGINSPSTEAEAWGGDIIAGLFNGLLNGIESIEWMCDYIWQTIQGAFAGVGTWFETTFSNAWQTVLDVFSGDSATFEGIKESFSTTFKEVFNRLAEGINKVIQKPFNSINSMLNQISGWKIGNQTPFSGLWGYNPIAIPQIPYLAKGAVIPPNAPFMAVLGDQRHGTNIEAPLSTIQEAMALVMEDYSAANMAGHSATVAVLREILEAVLGIEIGDEVIANAVQRHQTKMSIVRGG